VLTGQYADILQFLHAVEIAPQFVIIERMELTQSSLGRSGDGTMLELTLELATYFIAEPPPGVSTPSAGGSQ
jgi:Tfp pilus assembly protein PilO